MSTSLALNTSNRSLPLRLLYWSIVPTALCLIFLISLNRQSLDSIFNADVLYAPSMWLDLTLYGGNITEWRLPPAPQLFPDIALQFLFLSFGISFQWVIILTGMFQALYLFLSVAFLFSLFVSDRKIVLAQLTMALPLLMELGTTSIFTWMFSLIFWPIHHMFTFGGAVLCLALSLSLDKTEASKQPGVLAQARYDKRSLLLIALISLHYSSDRFFFVFFLFPFFAGFFLTIFRNNEDRSFITALTRSSLLKTVLVGFAIGLICELIIRQIFKVENSPATLGRNWFEWIWNSAISIRSDMTRMPLFCAMFILATAGWWSFALKFKNKDRSLLLAVLLFILPTGVLFPIITGIYLEGAYRYFAPLLLFFVSTTYVVLDRDDQLLPLILATTFFAILLLPWLPGERRFTSPIVHRPRIVTCIESNVSDPAISIGASDYWNARLLSLFVTGNPKMYQLGTDGTSYSFLQNRSWYKKEDFPTEVDFVLLTRIDPAGVRKLFGEPSRTK